MSQQERDKPATTGGLLSENEDDWETSEVAVVARVNSLLVKVSDDSTVDKDDDGSNVDVTTSALRQMRLVPPPPTQDGGVFYDSAMYQQQPPQCMQHAMFDPNAAYEQPVSPAIATAASALYGPLDAVLLGGLENPRERLTVLKLEDDIVRFIRNPREMQLVFPPVSSYHRLIIHRLAERCSLDHQTEDFNPCAPSTQQTGGGGFDGNSSRGITLFKTPQTMIPRVLLIDLSTDKQQPTVTPASAPKIMMRKRGGGRGEGRGSSMGRGNGSDGKNSQRTIEDREKAYAEARARIFGDEEATATSPTIETSSTTCNTSTPSKPAGGAYQAQGPDGSRGFARNGIRSGPELSTKCSPSNKQTQADKSLNGNSGTSRIATTKNENSGSPGATRGNTNGHVSKQNWKESKVLWRNREQELSDPDFTRNHNAYRPSRGDGYGGNGSYGVTSRFGGQSGNSDGHGDGPRPYGGDYQSNQSYGGRGGGRGARGEYNRIEQQSQHRPIPEYYRHPTPSPPPPPPGSYQVPVYSPHSRSVYNAPALSTPSQPPLPGQYPFQYQTHPHSPYHTRPTPRTTPTTASGGYNNDFPPLGK